VVIAVVNVIGGHAIREAVPIKLFGFSLFLNRVLTGN